MSEFVRDFTEQMQAIKTLPAWPYCFMASPLVPYGKTYKQYDTRGRLILWVNRDEIEKAWICARVPHSSSFWNGANGIDTLLTIPVWYA